MTHTYYVPTGGHPGQEQLLTDRAVFTEAYAVIPRGTMQDIVTSALPGWDKPRLWVLARPLSGFAETFSHYIMEVAPGGGSTAPEPFVDAEAVLFVVGGEVALTIRGTAHSLTAGGYVYLPPRTEWALQNTGGENATFHWIRKSYEPAQGLSAPDAFVTSEAEVAPTPMPGTDGRWSTTRFVDPGDLRHDMHVNIVTFEPGGTIPFAETHVMEHG
ncbi:MAG: (S)-ureidoglycine aminohydrolase, partial [Pseudomonadota bacterium]